MDEHNADPPESLGNKLQRLATISPADVRAIEIIVDDVLRRRLAYPDYRQFDRQRLH